ncbi:MAG: ABC transporter permease subunit [Lentisphaeria bacterium]|nr:ABC transporter permease subunit [Lentisphaeria bacterium]
MTALYQIAKNTLRESLREPIYLLLLLTALSLIGIFPIFTMFVFREQIKLVVDSAMATTLVLGWLLAVLCASHAISREIENGTALLLLAKPVERPVFIVAKILGILVALAVFCLLCAIATVISIRVAKDQFRLDNTVLGIYFGVLALSVILGGIHNYVTRSSFPMAAVKVMLALFPILLVVVYYIPVGGERVGLSFETVPALVLILYSVWAMGSLATALSTRFGLVSNLLLCVVIFVVGLMSDYLLGRHTHEAWSDSAPAGKGILWVSDYTFVPTETMTVGRWSRPEPADGGRVFTVWSNSENPPGLPPVGTQPEVTWRDGAGWMDEVRDLPAPPRYMARYDAEALTWETHPILDERSQLRGSEKGGVFTAFVFRRSPARPRTPVGGTYGSPYPNPGSRLASVLYACVPNWQLFWMADALAAKRSIPLSYVGFGGIYALLFVTFFVLLAVALFWQREVGTQVAA